MLLCRARRFAVVGTLAVLLGSLVSAAWAQENLPSLVPKLDPVWQGLARNNARFLSKDQQILLDDLGFAAAAADGCPGFVIDRNAFEQAFKSFRTDEYMKLSPELKRKFEYHLMMNFGATRALYAAEGYLNPGPSCRLAESRREAGPGRFWVPPASAAPAQ